MYSQLYLWGEIQGRDYILKSLVLSIAILFCVLLPTMKRYVSYGSQHSVPWALDIFYMLFYILCTWRGRFDVGFDDLLRDADAFLLLRHRLESLGAEIVVVAKLLYFSGVVGQITAHDLDKVCHCLPCSGVSDVGEKIDGKVVEGPSGLSLAFDNPDQSLFLMVIR